MDVPSADGAPWWGTALAAMAVAFATAIGAIFQRQRGMKKTEERSKHVVLESASIADMQPIRDIGIKLDGIAGKLDSLCQVITQAIEDRREEEDHRRDLDEAFQRGRAEGRAEKMYTRRPGIRARPKT